MRNTNLSSPTGMAFVGRGRELADLSRLFAEGARLVTILGTAGTGKTTLAGRFAQSILESAEAPSGGVWFCDLTEARTLDDIRATLAQTLEVSLGSTSAGDATAKLAHAMAARGDLLIVLDNFEQITRFAAASLPPWLSLAPGARFLVTSRERLRVAGEQCFELDPLSVPDAGDSDYARIEARDAVKLFVARARLVRPAYTLSDADAAMVARIVRRLDGIPLAIELCAARLGLLGVRQIQERLEHDFDVLGVGPETADARHRTLRASIDSSWEMLSADEREALSQCSVFRGGWNLEAAERVIALPAVPEADAARRRAILEVLQSLHDKSLLRADDARDFVGERRYRLYESIRDYARAKLTDPRPVEERHSVYFAREGIGWARAAEEHGGLEALKRLGLERDNLLAAHESSMASTSHGAEHAARALEILLSLQPVVLASGPLEPHVALLDASIDAVEKSGAAPALLGQALLWRGRAKRALGEWHDAQDLERAHELARGAGDRTTAVHALVMLAAAYGVQSRTTDAEELFERARRTLQEASTSPEIDGQSAHARVEARYLGQYGFFLAREGHMDEALSHFERALALHRKLGDRREEAIALGRVANAHVDRGALDEARRCCEEAVLASQAVGDGRLEGYSHAVLGGIDFEQGLFDGAAARFERALALVCQVGDRYNEGFVLDGLGRISLALGDFERARGLFARALGIVEQLGDRWFRATILGRLAAAEAASGSIDSAERRFEEARVMLATSGRAGDQAALELLHGYVDLACARRAIAEGAPADAERLRSSATAQARAAEAAGSRPSQEERFALQLLRRALDTTLADSDARSAPADEAPPSMTIGSDGRWLQIVGRPKVDLSRRRSLRLLLLCLADRHLEAPNAAVTVNELIEAGWPGDRIRPEAAARRVYTALSTLREYGLRELLIRRDDGYLFDPRVILIKAQPGA